MAREDTIIRFGAEDRLSPTLDKIAKGFTALDVKVAAFAAGAAAVAATVAGVATAIDRFDKIAETADRLDIASDALQRLGYAAKQSGSNSEALGRGLGNLNKVLGDALRGNAKAADKFKALGISLTDASGSAIDGEEAFLRVADKIAGMGSSSEQASAAAGFFGRTLGTELLPTLREGRGGLEAYGEELRKLGGVTTPEAIAQAARFRDSLDKLVIAGEGFFNGITESLLPGLSSFADELVDATKKGGGLVDVGRSVGDALVTVAGVLVAGSAEVAKFGASMGFAVDVAAKLGTNLEVVGQIAVVAFQSIEAASRGNLAFAQRGFQAIDKAVAKLAKNIEGDLNDSLSALRDQFDSIDDAAIERIGKLEGIFKNLGKSIRGAGDDTGDTGDAAAGATPKVVELAVAFGKLSDNVETFRIPVEDIAVEIEKVGDSAGILAARSKEDAEFFRDNWEGAVDSVYDAFTDLVVNGLDDWDDFGKQLESIAKQFLGNIVRRFLETKLEFGGSGAESGFGLGGASGFGGPGATGLQRGLGFLGGAAGVYSAYESGNPLSGAASGALAGFQVAGPYGAIIGAVIGGLAGLFGGEDDPLLRVRSDEFSGNRRSEGRAVSVLGDIFVRTEGIDDPSSPQIADAIRLFDNTIAELLSEDQIAAVRERLDNVNDTFRNGAATLQEALEQRFDVILGTLDETTQDFVRQGTTLEEQIDRLADVLSRPARVLGILDAFEDADRLAGMTEFERQLDAIGQQFDAARDQLQDLGASEAQLARIEELRAGAIERLNDAQADALDQLLEPLRLAELEAALSPAEFAILRINEQFDQLRDQAIALGATQEQLDLIERRRTAALREQAEATEQATQAIAEFISESQRIADDLGVVANYQADWLERLRDAADPVRDFLANGASVSSLTPGELFDQGRQQFEALARRAATGDFDAIRNIAGNADGFLRQAANFYGVGSEEFRRYEDIVRGTLQPIVSASNQDSMSAAQRELGTILRQLTAQQNTVNAAIVAELGAVRRALERIGANTPRTA
jgi:hypothetical protein